MPSVTVPNRRLGKKAQRLDERTFKFSKFLKPDIPPAPPEDGFIINVDHWPVFLNDQIGDCTVAAAADSELQWTTYAGNPVYLTDAQVLLGYEAISGYNPTDPTTDQGADMLTALNYWRKTGYGGHQIAAYAQVNPFDIEEIKQAIHLFGNLYIGLQLPLTVVQEEKLWAVPSYGPVNQAAPGTWGGHCVAGLGYGLTGIKIVSWGLLISVTWNFIRAYCDEMYAVLSPDWLNKNTGLSASGFNMDQLSADLTKIMG